METKIAITLDQARSWFRSGNDELMGLFGKEALVGSFRDITTFEKSCEVLDLNYYDMARKIATISKASAAMFKLNIIRKASGFASHKRPLHLTIHL